MSVCASNQITPPGGSWDIADNGTYSVVLQASQVSDTNNNFAAGGALGTFNVNAPDITSPIASGTFANVKATDTQYTFSVTFSDDVAVSVATLDGSDIRVTGPNGFDAPAAFQNVDFAFDGKTLKKTGEIKVGGGAAGNNMLMQFQADLLGVPVVRPAVTETTALGAAYLAGLAVGYWTSVDEVSGQWKVDRRFEPAMPRGAAATLRTRWTEALQRSKGWEKPG
jgi:hypothetical protein